jgi:nucleotide-binding universal stress UspA family protein
MANQIAHRAGEPPTLLTVIDHTADRPPPPTGVILSRVRASLEPDAPNVRIKVRISYPAKEITREAQQGKYDLLIVGGRQRRYPLSGFLLGSTALRAVKYAPCPVLVVKGKARPIRHILLCESGAESPSVGLSEVTELSAELRTSPSGELKSSPSVLSRFTTQLADLLEDDVGITVLHVMSQMSAGPRVNGRQLRAAAEELITESTPEGELLKRDIQFLARPGIRSRPRVRHGLVVDEILAEARDRDYDLVIIGAHRDKGPRHVLLDDLAYKIVARLERPVLVVR